MVETIFGYSEMDRYRTVMMRHGGVEHIVHKDATPLAVTLCGLPVTGTKHPRETWPMCKRCQTVVDAATRKRWH